VEGSAVEQFGVGLVLAEEALGLSVPEGESAWATVACPGAADGLLWVTSHPASTVNVVEGPVLLADGRASVIVGAPEHEAVFLENGDLVAFASPPGGVPAPAPGLLHPAMLVTSCGAERPADPLHPAELVAWSGGRWAQPSAEDPGRCGAPAGRRGGLH
jgi:hypothetical protein